MLDLIRAVLINNMPVDCLIDFMLEEHNGAFCTRLKHAKRCVDLEAVFFDLLVCFGTKEEKKTAWKSYRKTKRKFIAWYAKSNTILNMCYHI